VPCPNQESSKPPSNCPLASGPYLDQACANNPPLRHEVESLLRAYEASGECLESHACPRQATADYAQIIERPGTQIGEGGFGLAFGLEPGDHLPGVHARLDELKRLHSLVGWAIQTVPSDLLNELVWANDRNGGFRR
jgi:hypothetical protein